MSWVGVKGQTLTVDRLFALIDANNAQLIAARSAVTTAQQAEAVAQSARLPEVTASIDLRYLGNGRVIDRDFSSSMKAAIPHFGNTFTLTAVQPIYTGGAISAGVDLAKAQTRAAIIGEMSTRAALRMEAMSAYLNLYKASNLLQVYDHHIDLTERLLELMRSRHEQGVALRNDITRYELRLSSLRYDRTSVANNCDILTHDLRLMLGLGADDPIVPDTTLVDQRFPIDGEAWWQQQALEASWALKGLDAQRQIALESRRIVNAERLPHLSLVACENLVGPITIEIPAINKNFNSWFVGLNISYNISSLYKTNKAVKRSTLAIQEISAQHDATRIQLDQRISQAYTLYIQAYEMLATERKNVELSTDNYRIVNQRFINDLALLTDMLDASTALLDAEVRVVNALIDTIYCYYQLQHIAGTI